MHNNHGVVWFTAEGNIISFNSKSNYTVTESFVFVYFFYREKVMIRRKPGLLVFLLVYLCLPKVTTSFTVKDTNRDPDLLCSFIGLLLYSRQMQARFSGELVPSFSLLSSSNSNTSVVPRCFLLRIGGSHSDVNALLNIGPPLTRNEERHICFLYGCTKVPYSLHTTQLTSPNWCWRLILDV